MNENGLEFVEQALRGYDEWRRNKTARWDGENQLSVSTYLDELAMQQNADQLALIHAFAAEEFNTDAEVGVEVRRILGLTA